MLEKDIHINFDNCSFINLCKCFMIKLINYNNLNSLKSDLYFKEFSQDLLNIKRLVTLSYNTPFIFKNIIQNNIQFVEDININLKNKTIKFNYYNINYKDISNINCNGIYYESNVNNQMSLINKIKINSISSLIDNYILKIYLESSYEGIKVLKEIIDEE